MRLTPLFLKNQNEFEYKYPSIIISLLNNNLNVKTISRDGNLFGESDFPIFGEYLIIDNIENHKYIKDPELQIIDNSLLYAEKAFRSIISKDWNSFGVNLDLAFGIERCIQETNKKLDLIYSAARIGGAIGGYSSENRLFLVCPNNTKDIIEKGIYDTVRNYG